MEKKGLRVNMKKTELMVTGPGLYVLCDSGAFPCALENLFAVGKPLVETTARTGGLVKLSCHNPSG